MLNIGGISHRSFTIWHRDTHQKIHEFAIAEKYASSPSLIAAAALKALQNTKFNQLTFQEIEITPDDFYV